MDKPFNLSRAKLAKVNGKVSKNLPPIANNIAKRNNVKIIKILRPFEIFLDEAALIFFNKK